jgi:hypothetical protein
MKKLALLLWLGIICVTLLSAQEINEKVRVAVNGLTARLNTPMSVTIEDITLGGTDTTSGLSLYLSGKITEYAFNNKLFTIVAKSRGIPRQGEEQADGTISGTYFVRGDTVEVSLQLTASGSMRGQHSFTIPSAELKKNNIAFEPDNINAVKEREQIFKEINIPPAQNSNRTAVSTAPESAQSLKISAWPNSDTNIFIDGDDFRIIVEANQDCYFKIYHIDIENKVQMIFPRPENKDNKLQANVRRTVPDSLSISTIEAPFGQDTIIVTASTQQFPNIMDEFYQTNKASSKSISDIISGRGLSVQAAQPVQPEQTVSTRFNFTTLPSTYFDEINTFSMPDNLAETVQSMRAEVIRLGGTFSGDTQSGTFSYTGVTGSYRISSGKFILSIRYTAGNQLAAIATRSAGSDYRFTIDKPKNVTQAVQAVRKGIEGSGGSFSGNENEGSFSASGINGQYSIENNVNVIISKKPMIFTNSMIEKEVRKYFSGY